MISAWRIRLAFGMLDRSDFKRIRSRGRPLNCSVRTIDGSTKAVDYVRSRLKRRKLHELRRDAGSLSGVLRLARIESTRESEQEKMIMTRIREPNDDRPCAP